MTMDSIRNSKIKQIEICKKHFMSENDGPSLNEILGSEKCQYIINQCRGFRDRIYTPLTTLFLFIKQVLNPDKSCRNAVIGHIASNIEQNKPINSANTGPYCKARQRLPETMVNSLVKETGSMAEQSAKQGWRWHGRCVKLVDGTTLTMPDTKENQSAFPQHNNQKKGAGFPMVRMVAVMSLALGTVIDYAVDAYKGKGTGEHSLFRRIIDCLNFGDVLLGDRYYPSFFLIADLMKRGVDGVFHGQAQRHYDFRKGFALSKREHIIIWKKPVKPEWMARSIYDSYPCEIRVREFKVNGKIYVTTLLDHHKYHKKELAKLYDFRWQIEVNLRSIKSVLNMDHLSCKTPDMARKEIGIHLLGYNIIRILMAEACFLHGKLPNQVSFKGTLQLLNQFMPRFSHSINSRNKNGRLYKELLIGIVANKVGNRPGRIEPRVVKRRRKPFPALNKPRRTVRQKMINRINRRKGQAYACA